MRDDIEFNIQFCEEVEKYPVLFDYARTDYSNRSAQEHAWLKISEKIAANTSECRERWKNIRGSYSKYKAKLKTKSGQSTKVVKEYYLAPHLHFLDPFMKSRKSKGNMEDDTEDDSSTGMTEDTEKDEGDNPDIHAVNESTTSSIAVSPSSSVTDEGNFIKPIPSNDSDYRKRKRPSGVTAIPTISDVNRKAFQYFEKKEQMKNSPSTEPTDPDMAFFQSILPDMKQMNDTQKRHFKIGILNLAEQILSPTYNYGSERQAQIPGTAQK